MSENAWIEHDGGSCPVASGLHFERKHRNGDVLRMKAWHGNMRPVVWEHRGDDRDIIAYRLSGPSA
jgi:hypothetical protein